MQANPRLQALAVLIGEWTTVGAHPMLPGKTFHGRATFTWLESGAFLLFQSHIDEPEIPDGVAILGTDDAALDAGAMLYFDVRNVSREYRWTILRQRVDMVARRTRLTRRYWTKWVKNAGLVAGGLPGRCSGRA